MSDYKAMYRALVRRLVEIADNPSATERMIDYDRVARAHEPNLSESQGEPILGLVHDKGAAVPIPKREPNISDRGWFLDSYEDWQTDAVEEADG